MAALLALGLVLSGCGDDDTASDDTASAGDPAGDTAADDAATDDTEGGDGSTEPAATDGGVVMAGFAFEPAELTVAAGATIPVTNEDDAAHTFTSDDGGFDVEVEGGGAGEATAPSEPGSYDFVCRFHPSMTGTLTVE